jgi:PAS domain S-box-containing protein
MRTLLVIDDKQDNLITLLASLREFIPDCTVITAQSGPEGVEKARSELPDAILLDIRMPGMDGFEVCERLKSEEKTKTIPVVMITAAKTGSESRIKALNLGADGFLVRPIKEEELAAQVKTMLRIKKSEDLLRKEKDLLEEAVEERTAELVKANEQLKEEIEERKRAVKGLYESEERFRHAFENANTGVCLVSTEGRFIKVNNRLSEIFGYSREKLEGSLVNDITHPEDVKLTPAFYKQSISGGMENIVYKKRYIDGKGNLVWGQVSSSIVRDPRGKPLYFISHVQDITQQKYAEKALKKSEEMFSKLFQANPLYITLATLEEGRFVAVNDAFTRVTGYEQSDVIGRTAREIELWPNPDDRNIFVRQIDGDGQHFLHEVTLTRKDGRLIDGLWSVERIELEGKDHVISMLVDVTERKRTEKALWESEERYRLLVENQNDLVVKVNTKWQFLYVSPKYCETYGKTEEELLGKNFMPLVHENDRARVVKSLERLHHPPYTAQHEERNLTKHGWRWFNWVAKGILNKEGELEAFVSVGRDITDRKKTEEEKEKLEVQLQRAQKMEALGLLAGGVAHDLNNILSGIVSYPDLLLMKLPKESPLRKPIKTIKECGMKAADVVSDLLTIARGVAIGKVVLNLNIVVQDYLGSVEHRKLETIRPSVVFRTKLAPDLLNMNGSSIHLHKTLMNLVINASEAIEGTGTVTISTKSRYLDEPLKGYENVRRGEYAVLSVSDDGSGIAPEDLERVFEPFYTKKMMGRSGTGLGLAVVWNAVQDHNGYINIKSIEKGTVFELYFPVTRQKVAAAKEDVPLEVYLGHGERILVVDDQERQREIACGLLTELGYAAESVSSGEEAVEYVKKHPVDLIILDMIMPKGINGRETYEEISKIRPGQKAIIASGFSETKEVKLAQKLGAGKYMRKPYTMKKIGVFVKEELEK